MSSKVYVKNPNGKTYVYENTTYWDKETKTSKHRRACIGHMDPGTTEMVLNRKKGDAARGLALSTNPNQENCSVMGSGISLLLNRIAEETGLTKTLKRVFLEDWKRILSCAYFLASEGGTLCHAEKWSATNLTPFGAQLTSQRISELLVRITPELQQDFFKLWLASNSNSDYYAMDVTSVSSYSELIEFVRYGYNRDGEKLPQINLLMVTNEKNHTPLYYQIIPGSIKDVSTFTRNEQKRIHKTPEKIKQHVKPLKHCPKADCPELGNKSIGKLAFEIRFAQIYDHRKI